MIIGLSSRQIIQPRGNVDTEREGVRSSLSREKVKAKAVRLEDEMRHRVSESPTRSSRHPIVLKVSALIRADSRLS